MKKNKIISILESSIRNKLVISFLAISLIGASSMFLTYQNNISNTNLVTNKILLAKTTDLSNDNSYTIYTVQSGNTLSQIAYTHWVTVTKLQQWNNILNPNEIYIGQTLKIYTNSSSGVSPSSNSGNSSKITSKTSSSPTSQPLSKHTETGNNSSPTTKKSSNQISKKNSSNTLYKEGYIYNEWNMGLGIFEEPNENSNIAVMLRDGTSVKVLENVNGFYKIEFNGDNIGYVSTVNIVFSKKLAGNPASINKVGYMHDPWSTGDIDVYENSAQLTTPEAVLAQGTEVSYLGSSGNFDYIAFGPNYDEIAVVNSNFVTFQDPTISTNGTVRIGYISADWAYTYVLGAEQSSFEAAVRNGAQVKVIGAANADGFYKIEFGNGKLGYIQTSSIVFNKSDVEGPQSISKVAYVSSKDEVPVYTQLGDATPEATLTEGTKVAILGSASSGYYHIAFGEDYSEVGVISAKYLRFTEETTPTVEKQLHTKISTSTVV